MYWKASIRALSGYDSGHTTDWHNNAAIAELQELRQGFIQEHWDDAKNRIFVGNNPLDYTGDIDTDILETDDTENSLKAQSIFVYRTARTVRQLREIYRYFRRLIK